jgi:acylphosphatase
MSQPQAAYEQREILFSGTVQGVGFRFTTRRIAAGLAVTGYVQNLPDGRVRVVAEGAAAELNRLVDAIHRQMSGYIDNSETTVRPATGRFDHFEIRH